MKFLSELECKPWGSEVVPPVKMIVTSGLLVLAIFGMPVILQKFSSGHLSLPDILLFSALPGICAYGFFTPETVPLRALKRSEILPLLGCGMALLLITVIVNILWKWLLTALNLHFEAEQYAMKVIAGARGGDVVKLFFSLCIFAPLTEELLFRRIIYSLLLKISYSMAVVMTALTFSLCHFFVAGIPGLLVLGLGFQFSYLKFRNLSAAVILHAMVNSFAFWAALNK